jgi:hypothetical protein
MATFMDACAAGDATAADFDDYVERWHKGDGDGELWEFLGMTRAEYARTVENASALESIIKERG